VACGNPHYAYRYALKVDKGFQNETWAAVQGTEWEEDFRRYVLKMKFRSLGT